MASILRRSPTGWSRVFFQSGYNAKPGAASRVIGDINAISAASHPSRFVSGSSVEGSPDDPVSVSKTEGVSATELNQKIMAALNAKIAPEKQLLHSFLNRVNSPQEVDLAFSTLARLRVENCAYRKQISNFKESVSLDLINACIRAKVPKLALKTLNRKNIYGITPTLSTLHLLLNHASASKDIELLIESFRIASRNGNVKPNQATAKIIFNAYSRVNDVSRLLKMGKEFVGNRVSLEAPLHDLLIAAAANAGRKKQALEEIAVLRDQQSVPHTWFSGISMAKIYILKDDVATAADYVLSNLPDNDKQEQFEIHMKHMFHTWPRRLPRDETGECKALPLAKIRENLLSFESKIKQGGLHLPFSVDSEFPHHLVKSNDDLST